MKAKITSDGNIVFSECTEAEVYALKRINESYDLYCDIDLPFLVDDEINDECRKV